MMITVSAVSAARKMARYWCSPSALNASSGPYADDDSPSAPRPTHARNAAREMLWKRCGSWMSFGPPRSLRLKSCQRVGGSGGSGSGGGGTLLGADGGAGVSMALRRLLARRPGRRLAAGAPRSACQQGSGIPAVAQAVQDADAAVPGAGEREAPVGGGEALD